MNRIKELRESLGINQKQLAAMIGVSRPFLCDLEKNRRGARPETYQRIADVLRVPVANLMQKAV